MAKYQIYSNQTATNNNWVKLIPTDWKIVPLKYMCHGFVKDGPHETPEFIDEGVPFLSVDGIQNNKLVFDGCRYISTEDDARFSLKCKPQKGDILLGKAASVGKVAFVENDKDFNVWSPLAVIRPKAIKLGKFIYYCLQSYELQLQCDVFSNSNTQKNLGMTTIDNLSFPYPSIEEAEKISEFLDHETTKIDSLIEKQQKLIQLLKEKRQAVISHAVTKGLDPNVPMKDSGVEWLGEVPEHWEVCPLKFELQSLDYKRIPLSSEERGEKIGDYRYYGASGVIDFIDEYIFDESTVLVGEDGANLVNRNSPLAFAAHGKYWVNNHAHILKPSDGLADYWAELIELIDITPLVSGSAQPKLTAEALKNLKICFPSTLTERIKLDNFIKIQKDKYDLLMSMARSQIDLLQERRIALISAAVTGKIDVRNWQAA